MLPNAALAAHFDMVQAYARQLARKLPAHVELEELVSAGSLGLVEAAARFDEDQGVAFADFARRRVHGAMLDTLRSEAPSTRGARRRHRAVEACRRELTLRLGRPPETEELARALAVPIESVEQEPARLVSLELLGVDDDAQARVAEGLVSREATAEARIAAREARERVQAALQDLTERQRLVLSLYYLEELKLREIGELLGVTESRVCQLHTAGLKALRGRLVDADGHGAA